MEEHSDPNWPKLKQSSLWRYWSAFRRGGWLDLFLSDLKHTHDWDGNRSRRNGPLKKFIMFVVNGFQSIDITRISCSLTRRFSSRGETLCQNIYIRHQINSRSNYFLDEWSFRWVKWNYFNRGQQLLNNTECLLICLPIETTLTAMNQMDNIWLYIYSSITHSLDHIQREIDSNKWSCE